MRRRGWVGVPLIWSTGYDSGMTSKSRIWLMGWALMLVLCVGCTSDDPATFVDEAVPTAVTEATPDSDLLPTVTPEPQPTATHVPTIVPDNSDVPSGLASPFDASAPLNGEEFLSPFGVYRKSADRPEFGHSGIDVPMANGAPMFAVADGRIREIQPGSDERPGSVAQLLLADGSDSDTGWIFVYEHIDLAPGIDVGTVVERGQLLGGNAMPTGVSNNHLQLTFVFNEQGFTRDHTCWLDQLDDEARTEVDAWFGRLKSSQSFLSGWGTALDEGYYSYRGLLDAGAYPDGPKLCYEQGTDVREVY